MWQVFIELAEIKMDAECLYRPFKTLSQGERTRVMLAVLFAGENEFLLVDEPTNHLDIASREALEESLVNFEGTILFVSHDRYFINKIATRRLAL
jgi:lincosamide and streptogramin A transport system ATP-binding/permease protein